MLLLLPITTMNAQWRSHNLSASERLKGTPAVLDWLSRSKGVGAGVRGGEGRAGVAKPLECARRGGVGAVRVAGVRQLVLGHAPGGVGADHLVPGAGDADAADCDCGGDGGGDAGGGRPLAGTRTRASPARRGQ